MTKEKIFDAVCVLSVFIIDSLIFALLTSFKGVVTHETIVVTAAISSCALLFLAKVLADCMRKKLFGFLLGEGVAVFILALRMKESGLFWGWEFLAYASAGVSLLGFVLLSCHVLGEAASVIGEELKVMYVRFRKEMNKYENFYRKVFLHVLVLILFLFVCYILGEMLPYLNGKILLMFAGACVIIWLVRVIALSVRDTITEIYKKN